MTNCCKKHDKKPRQHQDIEGGRGGANPAATRPRLIDANANSFCSSLRPPKKRNQMIWFGSPGERLNGMIGLSLNARKIFYHVHLVLDMTLLAP